MSRAVLLRREKCLFLSCFCSETTRQRGTYPLFWWVMHNPFPEVSPHRDKNVDAVLALLGRVSSAELA